jgi:hypothetical protein
MRKKIAGLVFVAALSLAMAMPLVGASTASADKGGVPNDNACHGQIVSGLAKGQGLKHFAEANGTTVQALQERIKNFCD